jgi:hypothetical protein
MDQTLPALSTAAPVPPPEMADDVSAVPPAFSSLTDPPLLATQTFCVVTTKVFEFVEVA